MRTSARLLMCLFVGMAAIGPRAAAAPQDPVVPVIPRPVPQAPDQEPAKPPVPVTVEHEQESAQPKLQPPTVVSIHVEGAHRYTESQLVTALGQKVGEPLDNETVDKGLALLWHAFTVRGDVKIRQVTGGVELVLKVDEMNSDLEPRFVGNKEIKTEMLRHWALLDDKGELFLIQAERVRHRLLEGYHKEGYAFAEVDVVKRGAESGPVDTNELPDVIFEIREGPQVRVKDIIVHGSKTMPDTGMWWWKDGLKKLAQLELGGPWLFNWYGDKFVRETLDSDILAMREVYRDRGYLDAVVALDHLQYSDDHTGVFIHVAVDEGQPYTVSALHVKAVKRTPNPKSQDLDESDEPLLFPEEELLALCKLQPGERYERTRQNGDANKLRDYYGKRGYLSNPSIGTDYFEFLEPQLTFDPDARTVAVTYRLAQGRKRYIREVLFRGATHTRDRVMRREIDVLPGELADMTKIREGLQNLYGTRFFTNEGPSSDHHDPQFEFKPVDEDPNAIDLVFAVEEGKDINVQLQGGIDSDNGLFGRIALLLHNFDIADPPNSLWSTFGDLFDKEAFHGAGQELELELQPGTQVNSSLIRFLEPDIFGTEFNPWSLEVEWRRTERDERFYHEARNEKRLRLGHKFTRQFSAYVGYVNANVRVSDLDSPLNGFNDPEVPPLPDSIYQQQGTTNLSGVTLDFSLRNLDAFLNPRSGNQFGWHSIVYSTALGGDYDFVKSSVEADWFWMTGGDAEEVRPGFHLGLNAGIADPWGDTSEVPYTERFFLGGSRTLRGFDRRGVGPNRGDNTLGGETALWGSFEYRYPLYSVTEPGTYKQKETFRLTLFTDAGVLGVDPWNVDPSEVRWTYGFGLGMVQPFPVSLNFGFPIKDGEGDRKQVFSFSILSLWF